MRRASGVAVPNKPSPSRRGRPAHVDRGEHKSQNCGSAPHATVPNQCYDWSSDVASGPHEPAPVIDDSSVARSLQSREQARTIGELLPSFPRRSAPSRQATNTQVRSDRFTSALFLCSSAPVQTHRPRQPARPLYGCTAAQSRAAARHGTGTSCSRGRRLPLPRFLRRSEPGNAVIAGVGLAQKKG
jgi:hypothetical protein